MSGKANIRWMSRKLSLVLGAVSLMSALVACGQQRGVSNGEEESAVDATPKGHWVEIGNQQTYLKKTTDQSGRLRDGSTRCLLKARTVYEVQEPGQVKDKHVLVNLRKFLPGCGFSKGYIFQEHIKRDSFGGASGSVGGSSNAREMALLDTIAYAEGTNEHYNIMFSGVYFSSYARHPALVQCSSLCSDAAGRYQFLSTTWYDIAAAAGLRDFSPASQDKAALYLIRSLGVSNIGGIDSYNEFANAIYIIAPTWASLPGAGWGQTRTTLSELWQVYQQAVRRRGG